MKAVPLECKPCYRDPRILEFVLFERAIPLLTSANEIIKGNHTSPIQWFSRNKSDFVNKLSSPADPLPLLCTYSSLDSPYLKMDNRQRIQQLTSETYSVT